MPCIVDGCCNEVRYKEKQLCQKHYFRQWRNGTVDVVRKARPKYEDKRGYQFVYDPNHPLTTKGRFYISEHRKVLYEQIGNSPMNCALCKKPLTWETCCVDHIDENKRNNDPSNLRPTCMTCNALRNLPPAHVRMKNAIPITWNGETKTANEWGKDDRINISGGQIRRRKQMGYTDEECLFMPKKTHK